MQVDADRRRRVRNSALRLMMLAVAIFIIFIVAFANRGA
jgi:predicted nucleic acid-binding Zn ribbon protein